MKKRINQWTKVELKLMHEYIKLKKQAAKIREKLLKTRKISAINAMHSIMKK